MPPLISVLIPLGFLMTSTVVITLLIRNKSPKQRNLKLVLGIIFVLFGIKYAYEVQGDPPNYYRELSASRHSSFTAIRQAYKRASLKLHPDKNLRPEASYDFQRINDIYEVLSDEKLRDIYNRFGEQTTDPRLDEFAHIITLFSNALFWTLVAFVVTIPRGSKGCRTWMILSLIAVAVSSVFFQLSDATLPDLEALGMGGAMLSQLTEHELLMAVDRFVPLFFILFVLLSEYYYVNSDVVATEALEGILKSHAEMNRLLRDLQETVSHPNGEKLDRVAVEKKLGEVKATISGCNELVSGSIESLKHQGGSVGESYHWIVFALIYGGAYVLASS